MKTNFYYLMLGSILFLLFGSCQKDDPEITDKALDGAHAEAVVKSNILEYTDGNLTGEISILVVDDRGNYVSGLSDDNFRILENFFLDESLITKI